MHSSVRYTAWFTVPQTFPIYTGAVRHGPEFDLEVHRQKLRFFATSPYALDRTANDLRFWSAKQQVLYTKLYFQRGVLFRHKYLYLRSLSSATCFQNIVETIEAQNLTGLFAKETPFNSELIKQFYATFMSQAIQMIPVLGCSNGWFKARFSEWTRVNSWKL